MRTTTTRHFNAPLQLAARLNDTQISSEDDGLSTILDDMLFSSMQSDSQKAIHLQSLAGAWAKRNYSIRHLRLRLLLPGSVATQIVDAMLDIGIQCETDAQWSDRVFREVLPVLKREAVKALP